MEGKENLNQEPQKEALNSLQPENTDRPTPPPAPVQEKKDLLSRAEVKTMEKDISKLREEEAAKERERLKKMNLEPKVEVEKKKEEKEPKKKEEIGTLIPKESKKPSSFQKIAVRGIAILIFLAALGFVYWFWTIRLDETETIIPENLQEEVLQEEPLVQIKPELEIVENLADWGYSIPQTPRTIDTLILHSVYNDKDEDYHNIDKILDTFKENNVLTHYMISRTGTVFHLATDTVTAYHSGKSQLPDESRTGLNPYSIGIALVYHETEFPNERQLEQLSLLVLELIEKHLIPIENIFTYKEVSLSESNTSWNFDKEAFINSLIINN